MKRLLSFMLAIILTVSLYTGTVCYTASVSVYGDDSATWPSQPDIYAKSAVLIDASTGTILYSKKCHKKMYPASITKIMTALLTIENCDLDEEVEFSENAINSLSYDDANFGCQVGEKMTVKDCLYVLMLASANEVATALAEHIAGSVDDFANMMNERAAQAGATGTHFSNANGLHDDNHYVTAYDMAMITKAASEYSLFNEIVNTTTYTVKKNNKRTESATAYQRHKMVWPTSSYYYDGIIGGKTGYTDQSGTTLVTYAQRDGMTLIAVVLKSNSSNVYTDTATLLDYGFDNFNLVSAADSDSRFKEDDTSSLQSPFTTSTDTICIDEDASVIIPKDWSFSDLTSTVTFESSGDFFATITYSAGEHTVGTAGLLYQSISSDSDADTETTPAEETTAASGSNNSKDATSSHKKLTIPKWLIPAIIITVAVIILICIISLFRRRLSQIRKMKRHRKR